MSSHRKLASRGKCPFRIRSVTDGMGSYRLEELNGVPLKHAVVGEQVNVLLQPNAEGRWLPVAFFSSKV